MTTYIHGKTDSREVARLEKQAVLIAEATLPAFDAAPGMRVLDLATGVGAMAGHLLTRFPGIELVGIDLRLSQLASARANHPQASYVQGNGERLPFRDASFDRVHCSWLLEHVEAPVAILREVRRVLKPGGRCQFIEVDNASFLTEPALPEVKEAMDALNQAQIAGGGDPFIGPKLTRLFQEAGFPQVQTRPLPMSAEASKPVEFEAFIEEFAEIFESVDEVLGADRQALLESAARALRSLRAVPNARMAYTGWLAHASV